MADDPLKDAQTAIQWAIAELKAAGIAVPMSLHKAAHVLSYAIAGRDEEGCRVVPFKRDPGQ